MQFLYITDSTTKLIDLVNTFRKVVIFKIQNLVTFKIYVLVLKEIRKKAQ